MINSFLKIKDKLQNLIKDEPSLAELVGNEKKNDENLRILLKAKNVNLWLSWTDIFFVVIFFLLFLFFTHIQSFFSCDIISYINKLYPFRGSFFISSEDNHYQNLIAIHAGIGAVLIGLAFFVAQEIVKDNPYKGLVLLKRSKFFPLLVAEILFLFQFLWGSVNILSTIPIFIIGIFTINSLYQTLRLIADNYSLNKHEQEIFYNAVRSSFLKTLDFETTQILGNNKLTQKILELGELIDYSPFLPSNQENYVKIVGERNGILTNINFKKIKKLLDNLQIKSSDTDIQLNQDAIQNTQKNPDKNKPYIQVAVGYYSNIQRSKSILLWVRKDLVKDEEFFRDICKQAQKIFTIENDKFDYEEARNEIQKIKKRCTDLITDQNKDGLNRAINIYVRIIEDFYAYLKPYGGGFSQKQAQDMQTEMAFGGFRSISWLTKDIREIFDFALSSRNIDIIREVLLAPMRLMEYAIDHEDHLVFQQFHHYPIYFYINAYKEKNKGNDELSEFMYRRSWRYLTGLVDYHLEPKLKEGNYPQEEFKKFAISIFKIFQNLLKISFDNRDILSFNTYLSKTSNLFRDLAKTRRFENNDAEEVFEFLREKRGEIFFGMASWILFKLENDKEDKKLKEFFDAIKQYLPSDIKNLTEVFLNVHNFDVESFWGWDNWELEEKDADGEFVHSIQVLEKLEKLYAVQLLTLMQSKQNDEIDQLDLLQSEKLKDGQSRDLAILADGSRDLVKVLENIKNTPDSWEFILTKNAIEKVDKVKELLKKAKTSQGEADLKRKRAISISTEKISKFKEAVVKSFYENDSVRSVLEHYKLYENKVDKIYSGKVGNLGINTIFDKAPFFDDTVKWHIHFIGEDDGFDFGRGMVNGENSDILKQFKKEFKKINANEFESELVTLGEISDIVIITVNNASWRFFEEERRFGNYTPKWQMKTSENYPKEIVGVYKIGNQSIPIYGVYEGGSKPAIFIFNKKYLGKLVQYNPINKNQSAEFKKDIFFIDVSEFIDGGDLMKEFLNKPPEWLKEVGEQERQKEYLMERIVIKIFERFKFIPSKNIKGIFIEI